MRHKDCRKVFSGSKHTARAKSFVLAFVCLQLHQAAAVAAVVTIYLSGGCESSPFIHTLCLLSYYSLPLCL